MHSQLARLLGPEVSEVDPPVLVEADEAASVPFAAVFVVSAVVAVAA